MSDSETNRAVGWVSSICSIIGLIAVMVLQRQFDVDEDYSLLFWWLTTAMIAIAAISTLASPPSVPLRAIFVILFITQLPAFNWAWSERFERDTRYQFGFGFLRADKETDEQKALDELERENRQLQREKSHLEHRLHDSKLFWEAIAHLTGMGFALWACAVPPRYR